MSNTGYEAPDNPRQSPSILPEEQGRSRKISRRRGKRTGISRKTLSTRTRKIQQLRKIVDEVPEIREDRVVAAKQALQAGVLELRGEELAEKLLREILHKPNPEA
jgi:anti-sigma28 factor (negative regulator of flagellin synthesis)